MSSTLPPFLPLLVGSVSLVGWDGYSYVDVTGRTYWSGQDPTEADAIDAVNTPRVPAPPRSESEVWASRLAGGYEDATTGLKLKTTLSAQNRFTGMSALVATALKKEAMTEASEVTIFDYQDQVHTLTVAQFESLMLRYGIYYKAMFDADAP